MLPNLSVLWGGDAYAVDASEWRGGAFFAPVARELVAASGRVSERWRFKSLSVWVCEPLPNLRLWTRSTRKKEKMPRVLCTRVSCMGVLTRMGTLPPSTPPPSSLWCLLLAGRLFVCLVHIGVSCFRHRGHERNTSPCWKPTLLHSWSVSLAGGLVGMLHGC